MTQTMRHEIKLDGWEREYLRVLNQLVNKAGAVTALVDRVNNDAPKWKGTRTGQRTVGGFGLQLEVPLALNSLPLLLTKTVHVKSVIAELLWFLRGETNVAFLHENGCRIWDEWADANGELGPVYGKQWRSWTAQHECIDQIQNLVEGMKERPYSRRHIVSAWNAEDLPDETRSPQENVELGLQALAPCHMLFQVLIEDLTPYERVVQGHKAGLIPDGVVAVGLHGVDLLDLLDRYKVPKRSLQLRVDQRSADWVLGVPFNIASYAALASLLALTVGDLLPTKLIMQFGDYHLYENQVEAAIEQLERYDNASHDAELTYPKVSFPRSDEWLEQNMLNVIEPQDIVIEGYRPWGRIVAPVAV